MNRQGTKREKSCKTQRGNKFVGTTWIRLGGGGVRRGGGGGGGGGGKH